MEWCHEHESLLKDWAEKARYYSWMHHKAGRYLSRINNSISIPVIIISTATASANFTMVGNTEANDTLRFYFPLAVGVANVVTTILSALNKFLKCEELGTQHMVSHGNFSKLMRNICMDLSIPPEHRRNPLDACTVYRTEFDRLVAEAPTIPTKVIQMFNMTFPYGKNKPEIANEFSKISIYGRNTDLQQRENMYRKIRNFYKWASERKNLLPHRDSVDASTYRKFYGRASRASDDGYKRRSSSNSFEKQDSIDEHTIEMAVKTPNALEVNLKSSPAHYDSDLVCRSPTI